MVRMTEPGSSKMGDSDSKDSTAKIGNEDNGDAGMVEMGSQKHVIEAEYIINYSR